MATDDVQRSALISGDGQFRYLLERKWNGTDLLSSHTTATFIMLNPSTADGMEDDPTIRRCVRFARDWGHGALAVVNLFAYRATKPADLWKAEDPVGGEPQARILDSAFERARHPAGSVVIAAWGAAYAPEQVAEVQRRARQWRIQLHALAVNQNGSPCHPLYQPASATPVPWGEVL